MYFIALSSILGSKCGFFSKANSTGIGWVGWEVGVGCMLNRYPERALAETAWWTTAGPESDCYGKLYGSWCPEERLKNKHLLRNCTEKEREDIFQEGNCNGYSKILSNGAIFKLMPAATCHLPSSSFGSSWVTFTCRRSTRSPSVLTRIANAPAWTNSSPNTSSAYLPAQKEGIHDFENVSHTGNKVIKAPTHTQSHLQLLAKLQFTLSNI